MRFYRSKLIIVTFALLFCVSGNSQQFNQSGETDSEAALDTINLINQINYSVEVIRTYNNVIALEEEYRKISVDNLNLNRIRDEEALQLIRDISSILNSMRMNERARKWYQHVLTRDLKGAKLDGLAKTANAAVESVTSGSGGILSRLLSTATATALAVTSSFFDYKKAEHAFQGQFEDKQFELDTEKLNKLHEMNDMLLTRQWKLINSYKLDDRLRVTAKQVENLVRCLKDSNRIRCFQRIKPMARVFEVFPTYWHYRAAMAIVANEYDDALASCRHFEKINRALFRSDPLAANVAMIKVTAMLQSNHVDKDVVRKSLEDICNRNYDASSSDQSIFCTSVYLSALDDPEKARETLEPLMARLSGESENELVEYCDLFKRPDERQLPPPNMVDLVQCRMLRLAIDKKLEDTIHVERLKEICERSTTSAIEKLFYFGQLRIHDLWELAKKDIAKINLRATDGRITLEIPVTWFLLGNMDVSIELLKGQEVLLHLDGDERKRAHIMSHASLLSHSMEEAYVRIDLSADKEKLSNANGLRLKLKHVSWPVDIIYVLSENTTWIPSRLERFMGKDMGREIMNAVLVKKEASLQQQANQIANKPSAETDELKALFEKGYRYIQRVDESSKEEGLKMCHEAAERGYADAQASLGFWYKWGRYVCKNYEESERWYKKAVESYRKDAEKGNVRALQRLAFYYKYGYGVGKDDIEVTKLHCKIVESCQSTVEKGDVHSMLILGECYEKGFGVSKDEVAALKWYRKAAEIGCAEAQTYLSGYYYLKNDLSEAKKWANRAFESYRKSAEQGDAQAQFELAGYYGRRGGKYRALGCTMDKAEAFRWYQSAAKQGHKGAQVWLAECYYAGDGVKEDKCEAVKWYRAAAEQGNALAQVRLGFCYLNGLGVEENKDMAVKWFRKAAENGSGEAKARLKEMDK